MSNGSHEIVGFGWRRASLLAFAAWLIAGILFASPPVMAQEAQWSVQPLDGPVRVRVGDGPWRRINQPTAAGPGTEIETGAGARAVISRLGDTITVAPNSRLMVPVPKAGEPTPNILQALGTALYRMLTRVGGNQFEVQTPYLAAIIKGTVFAVSVTPEGGALHVTEGLVQVRSRSTGQRALIAPGQTAHIASRPGAGLEVHTPGKGRSSPNKNNVADDGQDNGGQKNSGQKNGGQDRTQSWAQGNNAGQGQGQGQGQT